MSKRHIVFVPGKNPKPPADLHQNLLWQTLVEGVRRVEPDVAENLASHDEYFRFINWNYSYYQSRENIEAHRPWVDKMLAKGGPSDEDIELATAWRHRLDMFMYNTVDNSPVLMRLLRGKLKEAADDTHRYFENENKIASHIREQLKEELRPLLQDGHKVLLIGHSMGTIISYDTLWALSNLEHLPGKVDMFLTLGSPLGMNYVQERLLGNHMPDEHKYPSNIRYWVNIAADGDLIALDRFLENDYSAMVDYGLLKAIKDHSDGVYNYFYDEDGLNCHRSYGYLINHNVAQVIANWWQSTE
ncbi:hypothetical protein GQR58_028194 [Nymphon striatum]|nr:hypothetical protein GQR58_028194 [Nymphon striatum]